MTPHLKYGIAGVIIGLILLIWVPWVALGIIAAAIIIPVVAYAMLDPAQRRRLKSVRSRRQLGG
jgi:hypothetical protein